MEKWRAEELKSAEKSFRDRERRVGRDMNEQEFIETLSYAAERGARSMRMVEPDASSGKILRQEISGPTKAEGSVLTPPSLSETFAESTLQQLRTSFGTTPVSAADQLGGGLSIAKQGLIEKTKRFLSYPIQEAVAISTGRHGTAST